MTEQHQGAAHEDDYIAFPWQALGKCQGLDPAIFFPSKSNGEVMAAKRICKGEDGSPECPVRRECLQHAMDHDERFGVWGGTSERERRRLRRTWRKGSSAA